MDYMENGYSVMSKKEINSYRHKSERRWYIGLIIINILIILFSIIYFVGSSEENKKYFENLETDISNVVDEAIKGADSEKTDTKENSLGTVYYDKDSIDDDSEFNIKDTEITDEYEAGYYDGYLEASGNSSDSTSNTIDESSKETAMDKLKKRLDNFPEDIKLLGIIVATLIFLPIGVSYIYGMYRSMSIKVTKKNFPEIYDIVEEYTIRLGMKKMPDVYIIQGNGVLNAFSAFIPFKQYIELYADLVEVAYREYNDLDSLRFIIGHEMAHIRLKHATMHYRMLIMFASYIPIISDTASRAREYSCDRIAQVLSGSDGIDAIMSLTAGIHLYKRVDKDDYLENAKKVNGFFVWCYNLVSDHPITTKRILALKNKERSGKLY